MAGSDIWFGIVAALLLCMATAISYAELAKIYPGAGSSYFFAEQAFLSKTHAYKFARIAKFIIGWASHLYYWVYPGFMVGVTAIVVGYMAGDLFPQWASVRRSPAPLLMIGFCVVFAIGVGYIAYRGANTSTGINLAVNVVQISGLCWSSPHRHRGRLSGQSPRRLERLDAGPRRHPDQVHPRHLYAVGADGSASARSRPSPTARSTST